MDTVGIGDTTSVVAILFSCPSGQHKEVVQAYADEILKRAQARGMNTSHPNFYLLGISLEACGGRVTYRTADDVPLVDVPCPCGDPNHWLIKWEPPLYTTTKSNMITQELDEENLWTF